MLFIEVEQSLLYYIKEINFVPLSHPIHHFFLFLTRQAISAKKIQHKMSTNTCQKWTNNTGSMGFESDDCNWWQQWNSSDGFHSISKKICMLQVGSQYVSWIKGHSCDVGQVDRVVDPRWGPNLESVHLCFLVLINICTITAALFTFRCLFRDCFVWPSFLLCINCAGMHLWGSFKAVSLTFACDADLCYVRGDLAHNWNPVPAYKRCS